MEYGESIGVLVQTKDTIFLRRWSTDFYAKFRLFSFFIQIFPPTATQGLLCVFFFETTLYYSTRIVVVTFSLD
jgi:hypothetical protein